MVTRALTSTFIATLLLLAPTHTQFLGSNAPAHASGHVLYSADWSGGFNGWTASTSWKTVGGMLVNDGSEDSDSKMSASAPVNLASTPDYTVEADIQLVRFEGSRPDGSFGIVVRADGDGWGYNGGPCSNWYPCSHSFANQAGIGYGKAHETIGVVDFIPGTDWHHYSLTVSGNTIGLTVDGRLVVGPVSDSRALSGGRVGLWSNDAQINVRSFVVSTSDPNTTDCNGQQIPVDKQCPPPNHPPGCAGGGATSPGKFNVDACRDLPGLDTGINVPANSTIQTSATGTAHYGRQKDCSAVNPDGQIENGACSPKFDKNAVLPSAPIGELLARIGASGPWFAIGSAHSGTTPQAGELFLIFNDVPSLYGDNDGTYQVSIDIQRTGGGPPRIVKTQTYTERQLVYLAIFYTDDDNDATGFGFRGANGSGWGEENHPFSNPSYGRVSQNRVDYPFNHLCGTSQQYESDVEAWIYDSQGQKSQPVITHLACSGTQPPTGNPSGGTTYQEGYKKGFSEGFQTAKANCRRPDNHETSDRGQVNDYERGYGDGFNAGFDDGYRRFCANGDGANASGHNGGKPSQSGRGDGQ